MIPLLFWTLIAFHFARFYSQTRLMVTASATTAAYIFLPGHIYLICPVVAYCSLPAWIRPTLKLRHIAAVLCALIILGWSGLSMAIVNDLKTYVEDAVMFPHETIVEPFVEAFHNGLSTIDFYEGLAQDKEELVSFFPVATKLITSPSAVYRGAVEGQRNVHANIVDVPGRFYEILRVELLERLFLANMRVVLIVLGLIIALNWIASRMESTNSVDLGQQRAANAELIARIEAQNAQVQAADEHVCAIHASCEALLSFVWANVFCPGARRHIDVLEMESIPRSLPLREPRAARDVMFTLRHRLGARPGLNMPAPAQIDSYDPAKKHIALEAIYSENLSVMEALHEEGRTLAALKPILEQLGHAIKRDAAKGHPYNHRAFIPRTPAEAAPDLQRYSEYLALKQQDPTAPHLESYQRYELYLASGQPRRRQALPVSPVSPVSSVFSMPSAPSVHAEPQSPTAVLMRFSEAIESRLHSVQRDFCNGGQSPLHSIYAHRGRYPFPEPRASVPESQRRVVHVPEQKVRPIRKNVPQDGDTRPESMTKWWKEHMRAQKTAHQPAQDEERAQSATPQGSPVPEPLQTPPRAFAPPAGPVHAEVEVEAAPVPPAAAPRLEYREAHVAEEESPTQPSNHGPQSLDRKNRNDGRGHFAAPVDLDPAAVEPKTQEAMAVADVDDVDDALAAFSGLQLGSAKKKSVKWADVLEQHAVFRCQDSAGLFVDAEELQRHEEEVYAISESLFSSIPQQICLDGWPTRYLPRRLIKAKYSKPVRFQKRVERTWTRRARGGRRIETLPPPTETSADALELTRNTSAEEFADTPALTDAPLGVQAVVDTPVTSTAEADAGLPVSTSAGPSITPALESSTEAAGDSPEEDWKELWTELFGVSPDSSNNGEAEESIVHESQIPESDFTFDFPMPTSDPRPRAGQSNLPPLFLPSIPLTATTPAVATSLPVTTQSSLPSLYLPPVPSPAVAPSTESTDSVPEAPATKESNAEWSKAIPEEHQEAKFTFSFHLPTTNPFANQSNVRVDQLPAPSQPATGNQPQLASTEAVDDEPEVPSAAESQLSGVETQPENAQGADEQEQTDLANDAFANFFNGGDQEELLEAALAALDIACGPENQYAAVTEDGGQGTGEGADHGHGVNDLGGFDFGSIGPLGLGAFDFPNPDAADTDTVTHGTGSSVYNADNDAAIVADAAADLNSQLDLDPLSTFFDMSRYYVDDAGEYATSGAGTTEAPGYNPELQDSEFHFTGDIDFESVAAFEAATGLAGQIDAEIDDIFGGIVESGAPEPSLQADADAHVSGDPDDFDAEAVAAFALAEGLSETADAELANIFGDADLPASAQPEEPVPGGLGDANAEAAATATAGSEDIQSSVSQQDEAVEEGDLSSLFGGYDEDTEGESHVPASEAFDAAATPQQDVE